MSKNEESPEYRILDLFSGAGGFSLGLELLENFKTVVANDIMKDALTTLDFNFPECETILGDISDKSIRNKIVEISKEKKVNMIIGGPPCQGFSNKGKKLGLNDPRNFLFREYLKIVETLQPEVFVIENVKAMSTSTNGWFMDQILTTVKELGYDCSSGILTASDFGVPQSRQRTFIIASKKGLIALPTAEKYGKPKTTVKDAISDLIFLESGEGSDVQPYRYKPKSDYQRELRASSTQLFNHKATNHAPIALQKLKLIPAEQGKSSLPSEMHGNQKFKTTWGRLKWDQQSPTIDTRFDTPSNGTNSHPTLMRSITPREAARIQSFPDSFVFHGTKTNIGKQIGNAVPPLLAKVVGMAILDKNQELPYEIHNVDANKKLEDLLREGVQVDHIITDPPYNISKKNNFATMTTSNRKGVDFGQWDKGFDLTGWIETAGALLKPGGTFIIFNSYRNLTPIIEELEKNGLEVKDLIRWVKTNPMPRNTTRRYVQDSEYAIWAVKPGKPWIFNKPKSENYLRAQFSSSTVSGLERTSHPTQKSLKLIRELVSIHTDPGQVILDPFMGSGTTGVAANSLGRKFLGIELEKEYFQIAKNRLDSVRK